MQGGIRHGSVIVTLSYIDTEWLQDSRGDLLNQQTVAYLA